MQRKLVWAADARRDLAGILGFISERNAPAADRMEALINSGAQRLLIVPFGYRPGRIADTREAIIHPN